MAGVTAAVNPHVFVVHDFAVNSYPSSLAARDGLALIALAGLVVAAELIASTWIARPLDSALL